MAYRSRPQKVLIAMGVAVALATTADTRDAHACGCFTPPDPSVPVIQAGERIAFAMKDGIVTAHIQIQYQGDAKEFGWLLPLPSVPEMELGTDELFNQLTTLTQPKYRLVRKFDGNCGFGQILSGNASPSSAGAGAGPGPEAVDAKSVLVIQASIGPYDYAVLKADSKEPMLKWLADNRYFVPAGTDETVGAYIRPGAFFLALKLQSGQSSGDLQPVVVKYASDLPMIPIVLTSVAAQPNMGIQVWMLGDGRAIPRNYYHTVINDQHINWFTSGANYNDVIIKAVGEAKGKHSFVTEYAGSSQILKDVLNPPGRFGTQAELASQLDAIAFVEYMLKHNFPLTSQVVTILGRSIPFPPALEAMRVTPQNFYSQLRYFLGTFRTMNPAAFEGWPGITYKPEETSKELFDRVVKPTLAAGALFDENKYLTRLYTTLSPEDMNLDPVFSFNPKLNDVGNVHEATLTYYCGFTRKDNQSTTPARLVTEQGWSQDFPDGTGPQNPLPPTGMPYSRKIEVLREVGPAEIVIDNPPFNTGCGCSLGVGGGFAGAASVFGLLGVALLMRRRRSAR